MGVKQQKFHSLVGLWRLKIICKIELQEFLPRVPLNGNTLGIRSVSSIRGLAYAYVFFKPSPDVEANGIANIIDDNISADKRTK